MIIIQHHPREASATSATTDSTEAAVTSETTPVIPAPAEQPRGGMFAALTVPNFRVYVTGSFVSNIGTWMQRVAQDWLVLELSGGSGVAIGITTALQSNGVVVPAGTVTVSTPSRSTR